MSCTGETDCNLCTCGPASRDYCTCDEAIGKPPYCEGCGDLPGVCPEGNPRAVTQKPRTFNLHSETGGSLVVTEARARVILFELAKAFNLVVASYDEFDGLDEVFS